MVPLQATQGRRQVLRISALLFGAVAALSGWIASQVLTDRLPRRSLPDGSTITLEAVAFGKHVEVRGAWWRKALYYALPTPLKSRAGCRVFRGGGGNTLCAYLRVRGPLVARSRNPMGFSTCLGSEKLRDEHGCGCEPSAVDFDGAGNETIKFAAFPRRGKSLRLEIGDPGGNAELARFAFPNPDPGPHPAWIATALPTTARDGDVAVTLTRFEARPVPDGFRPAVREGWVHATFRVTKGGHSAPSWYGWPVSFSTAGGDEWHISSDDCSQEPRAEHFVGFDTNRWRDEPVWKMRMEVSPRAGSPWPDAAKPWAAMDTWTIPGVVLPSPHQRTTVAKRGRVHGVVLELSEIVGARSPLPGRQPYGGAGGYTVPHADFRADWSAAGRPCEFFVFARDRRGRLYEVPGNLGAEDPTVKSAASDFWLHLPAGVHKVDLIVVAHPHRYVEFLVRNPFLQRAGSRRR